MFTTFLYLLLAAGLIFLNGFFVLCEFALVKIRATRLDELARGGDPRAVIASRMIRKLDAYLSACQLGITMASLALGWIGEPSFARLVQPLLELPGWWPTVLSHSIAVAVGFVVITLLHIIVGEQAPKLLSIRKAEAAILFCARPLDYFYRAFYLPLSTLNWITNLVLRLLRVPPASDTELAHSEEELRMILGSSHEQGQFTLSRLLMMENILDFGTLTVSDVMVPKGKVIALSLDDPWEKTMESIRRSLHSRYPVTRGGPEKVVGFVHIKDLALEAGGTGAAAHSLDKIRRRVLYVDAQLHLEDLLKHFHSTHSHLALVRDAEEQYVGLVTLEDVVEELVGTIRDEFEQVHDFKLSDVTHRDAILLDLGTATKTEALKALVDRLAIAHPRLPIQSVVASVSRREAMASTGLGGGVALPHARVDGLIRPIVAFGRSRAGLDYHALDKNPVHLIFLMVTPTHDEGAHMSLLGKLSVLLSSQYLRERLLEAATPEEVAEILRTSDQSLPA